MKQRFYIIDHIDGNVTYTDNEEIANRFAQSDTYMVIDTEKVAVLFEGITYPISELD